MERLNILVLQAANYHGSVTDIQQMDVQSGSNTQHAGFLLKEEVVYTINTEFITPADSAQCGANV